MSNMYDSNYQIGVLEKLRLCSSNSICYNFVIFNAFHDASMKQCSYCFDTGDIIYDCHLCEPTNSGGICFKDNYQDCISIRDRESIRFKNYDFIHKLCCVKHVDIKRKKFILSKLLNIPISYVKVRSQILNYTLLQDDNKAVNVINTSGIFFIYDGDIKHLRKLCQRFQRLWRCRQTLLNAPLLIKMRKQDEHDIIDECKTLVQLHGVNIITSSRVLSDDQLQSVNLSIEKILQIYCIYECNLYDAFYDWWRRSDAQNTDLLWITKKVQQAHAKTHEKAHDRSHEKSQVVSINLTTNFVRDGALYCSNVECAVQQHKLYERRFMVNGCYHKYKCKHCSFYRLIQYKSMKPSSTEAPVILHTQISSSNLSIGDLRSVFQTHFTANSFFTETYTLKFKKLKKNPQ